LGEGAGVWAVPASAHRFVIGMRYRMIRSKAIATIHD
jgi:hypothetical protein